MHRRGGRVLSLMMIVGMLLGSGGWQGCAQKDSPAGPTTEAPSTSGTVVPEDSLAQLMADLARSAAPMPIYGLPQLPVGATVAAQWWPVVELESPTEYDGPPVANPRMSGGQESEPEIQLILDYRGGWLVLLENFRGDLGDVEGEQVGTVGDSAALRYEVNGGTLVQWSDGGRWYGVFGRTVAADDVVAISLEMRRVEAEDGK